MSKDTGLIQLAGMQSLSTLNDVLKELTQQVEILRDERDEYRRKWLEAIDTVIEVGSEKPNIKQISS
jgi:uncharacterized protein YhaN